MNRPRTATATMNTQTIAALFRWNFIWLLVVVPTAAVMLGNDPVFWVLMAAALVNFALWAAWSRRSAARP